MPIFLTEKEVQQYWGTGYLVKRAILPENDVQAVIDAIDSLTDTDDKSPRTSENQQAQPIQGKKEKAVFYHETLPSGKKVVRRVERVSDSNKVVEHILTKHEVVMGCLKDLYKGEDAVLFKDKLNLKLPGGAGFMPHIDGHFKWIDAQGNLRKGWAEYASDFINILVPIDSATVENGCVQIAPRNLSHKSYEDESKILKNDGTPAIREEEVAKMKMTHVEAEPGDLVFFDWRCPHKSDRNTSNNSRRVLYSTYNRLSEGDHRERYYQDKEDSQNSHTGKALVPLEQEFVHKIKNMVKDVDDDAAPPSIESGSKVPAKIQV